MLLLLPSWPLCNCWYTFHFYTSFYILLVYTPHTILLCFCLNSQLFFKVLLKIFNYLEKYLLCSSYHIWCSSLLCLEPHFHLESFSLWQQDSFSFFMSENAFILFSLLKDLVAYRIQMGSFFSSLPQRSTVFLLAFLLQEIVRHPYLCSFVCNISLSFSGFL